MIPMMSGESKFTSTAPLTWKPCKPSTPILMYDKDNHSVVMTLEQLLPMSFGPDQLQR